MQWNTSIAATLEEQNFGQYIGVALLRGCFVHHLGPGFLVVIQIILHAGVAVWRGSTVYILISRNHKIILNDWSKTQSNLS